MTAQTKTLPLTSSRSEALTIVLVAFLGLAVLFVAGFAKAEGLHGATHDTRHATGFPCH